MAWNKKTPDEEFEEQFGMSRADFNSLKSRAEAAETKAAELETKYAETQTSVTELQNSLAALKAPPQPRNESRPEPTNFFENPDQAFNERMAPVMATALNANASLEEMKARQKYDRDFRKYGKEIEDLVKTESSLVNKANPVFWENVVNIVRGRHVSEIEESALKGQAYFTEQPGGGSPGSSSEDTNLGLSNEQMAAAKRMGMSNKEFRENLDYSLNNYGHTKGAAHVN